MIGNRPQNVPPVIAVKFPKERKPLQDLGTNVLRSSTLLENKLQQKQPKEKAHPPEIKKPVVVYAPKHGIRDASTRKDEKTPRVETQSVSKRTFSGSTSATSGQATQVHLRQPKNAAAAIAKIRTQLATMRLYNDKCDDGHTTGKLLSCQSPSPQKQQLENNTVANGYVKATLNAYLPNKKLSEVGVAIAPKSESAVGHMKKTDTVKLDTDCKLEQPTEHKLKLPSGEKEKESSILNAAAREWKAPKSSIINSHIKQTFPAPTLPLPNKTESFLLDQNVPYDIPTRGRVILGRGTSPVAELPFTSAQDHRRERSQASSGYLADLLDERNDEVERYLKQREMRRHKAIQAILLEQKRNKYAPLNHCQRTTSMDQRATVPNPLPSVSKDFTPSYPYGGSNRMVGYEGIACCQQYDPMGPYKWEGRGQQVPASGMPFPLVADRIRYEPSELLKLNYRKESTGTNKKEETKPKKRL